MRIHRPVGDGVNDAAEPGGSQALQRMCLALFNIYSNFLPDSGPAFTGRAVNNSLAVTRPAAEPSSTFRVELVGWCAFQPFLFCSVY
jgi:hypothetical protein